MVLIVTRYRYWYIMSETIILLINITQAQVCLSFWFQICDNTACERDKDGRLCGGCGICRCGKCDCEPCKLGDPNIIGDPGDTCECSLKKCRAPDDPRICSGNGICDCDTCNCNDRYTGNSSFANNISTAILNTVCLNVIRPTQFFPIYLQDRTVRNVKLAGTHVKNCELALSVYFSEILQGYRKNQKMR